MKEFLVEIPKEIISKITHKVQDYPWHEMPDDGGWDYGTNLAYMKEVCDYWVNDYSWQSCENYINEFSNYKTTVGGLEMHFIVEKGSNDNAQPLLIAHGWPGSFLEVSGIIKKLAHPELFGGDAKDSFDVIVPSLPGFGFSQRPKNPYGPRKIAQLLNTLMVDILGYNKYIAHGNDWGSAISSWIAYDFPNNCKGIHICFPTMRHVDGAQTKAEKQWEQDLKTDPRVVLHDGYRTQQETKPQTLSYAMMDSPVGIAAWIIEKCHGWSDIEQNDIESVYSKDQLLNNIMLYIVTKTFNTSTWIYYGRREEGGRILGTKKRPNVEVPTAIAVFPKDSLPWPPASYVRRLYNVVSWTEMPKGGHFPANEQPSLLINDIVKFLNTLNK